MSLAWNPSGPISIHHCRKLGCHCSRARCSFLSSARLTWLGIFSSLMWLMSSLPGLRTPEVEVGALPRLSVEAQGAALAHGVGALEDPVLPGAQPAEDLRL